MSSGICARKDCAEKSSKTSFFRPIISGWTLHKSNLACPKNSQVGWCNRCWNRHYRDYNFLEDKIDLLYSQILVWNRDFGVKRYELMNKDEQFVIISPDDAIAIALKLAADWQTKKRKPWKRFRIRPIQ